VTAIGMGLAFGAYTLGQVRIPCRGQRNAPGHGCGWSKIANTDRAVCHLQSRPVQTRQVANEKAVNSTEQVDLFLERHLAEDRFDPALDLGRGLDGRRCW